MEEQIIQFLIQASAVSQASGKTFLEIMAALQMNETTLRGNLNRLIQQDRIAVSAPHRSILSRDAEMRHNRINALEMRMSGRDWTLHHGIVLWLGPVELERLKERKQQEDLISMIKTVADKPMVVVHGDNTGVASAGHGNTIAQSHNGPSNAQSGGHGVVRPAKDSESTAKKILVGLIITVVGGLIVWALTSSLS